MTLLLMTGISLLTMLLKKVYPKLEDMGGGGGYIPPFPQDLPLPSAHIDLQTKLYSY